MRPKVPFRRCRLTWGGDPAEACVVVILMMVQDGDDNLNQKVLEAQAQMTAKQTIRAMFAQLNQIEAMLTQYGGHSDREHAAIDQSTRCRVPRRGNHRRACSDDHGCLELSRSASSL